jgi:4-amino-4-deoxy-L-arabinose transferase-like glycosyltransferase
MKVRKFNVHQVFALFTLSVALAIVLPDLLRHGMFMDGTQYAIIARNYAEGSGTFWFPFLSSSSEKHGQTAFLEHPPLIYFLQSSFFKIGGQSFLCERMYSLLTLILAVVLITLIWRLIFKNHERLKNFYWFPILLWIIIPTVSWAYKNNMHENTVSVFVLATIYSLLKSVQTDSNRRYFFIFFSGVLIFLATLSKGLPGLFPLSFYFIYAICFKNITLKKVLSYTFLVLIVPILIYFLIVSFNDAARESLSFHVKERLFYRIANNPQVENRFVVLFWFFRDIILPSLLVLLIAGFLWVKGKSTSFLKGSEQKKYFFLFLFVGLAGVLPLALTLVQRAVYYAPALPFLSIALALLFIKEMNEVVEMVDQKEKAIKFLSIFSATALLVVIIYSFSVFGDIGRDETEFNDAMKIAEVTGDNAYISAKDEIYQEWGFQYYLLRYHHITIDPRSKQQPYMLLDKGEICMDSNYKDVQIILSKYKLMKRMQ